MALLTTEKAPATLRITKQYRALCRCENGLVCYVSVNDTEGSDLLLVRPDGSMHRHIIIGVCHSCAGLSGGAGCGLGDQCPREKNIFPVPVVAAIEPKQGRTSTPSTTPAPNSERVTTPAAEPSRTAPPSTAAGPPGLDIFGVWRDENSTRRGLFHPIASCSICSCVLAYEQYGSVPLRGRIPQLAR